jgi:tetratricopeptide (TPR) repeat protein
LREQAGLGDHPGTANAHRLLGKQYRYRKEWDKALAQYELSRRILVAKFGADSPELTTTWIGIGDIEMDAGRAKDAIPYYERALALTARPEAASHRSEVEEDLAKARAAIK